MYRSFIGLVATAIALVPAVADAVGEPDPDFGTDGVVEVDALDDAKALTVDADGRSIVVGRSSGSIAVARYLPNGSLDTSFSGDGVATTGIVAATYGPADVRVLADGSIITAGRRTTDPANPFSNGLWALKLTDAGAAHASYGGGDGESTLEQGFTSFQPLGTFAPDGSIVIVQGGIGGAFVTAVSATGQFDDSATLAFDDSLVPDGCVAMGPPTTNGSVTVAEGEFVHMTGRGLFGCSQVWLALVIRQDTDGTIHWSTSVDWRTTDDGAEWAAEIVGADVVLAEGTDIGRVSLDDGETSPTWGTGGVASVDAAFGEIGGIAGLPGDGIAIVNAPAFFDPPSDLKVLGLRSDGTVDPDFDAISEDAGGALVATAISSAPGGDLVTLEATDSATRLRRFVGSAAPAAVPIVPARLLDTRPGEQTIDGQSQGAGFRPAQSTTKVRIAGRGGIPTDATAAIVNLTIVGPDGPGFATTYPCTPDVPLASNINYAPGDVVANSATVKLDTNGDLCIYTYAGAHILIDANAYVPGGSSLEPIVPARLLDTRPGEQTIDGQSQGAGFRPAQSTTKVRIAGRGGIPTDATAAIVNLTIVGPDGPGFATTYPCTPDVPLASNINYAPGDVVANSATVKLDTNGDLCIYTYAGAHILIDANAYVPGGSSLEPIVPARLLDTRPGEQTIDGQSQGAGFRPAQSTTKVRIAGRGGIPTDATAAIVNLTIVGPDGPGFATTYPCTPDVPLASNINYAPGDVVANSATVKLDTNGDLCIYTYAGAHILIDANAYIGS